MTLLPPPSAACQRRHHRHRRTPCRRCCRAAPSTSSTWAPSACAPCRRSPPTTACSASTCRWVSAVAHVLAGGRAGRRRRGCSSACAFLPLLTTSHLAPAAPPRPAPAAGVRALPEVHLPRLLQEGWPAYRPDVCHHGRQGVVGGAPGAAAAAAVLRLARPLPELPSLPLPALACPCRACAARRLCNTHIPPSSASTLLGCLVLLRSEHRHCCCRCLRRRRASASSTSPATSRPSCRASRPQTRCGGCWGAGGGAGLSSVPHGGQRLPRPPSCA